MRLLDSPIKYDEIYGQTEGDEYVRYGLDAMASALSEWKDLEAVSLDEVLAELGQDDTLVETAARLAELVGRRATYEGLAYEDAKRAEGLRETLVEALDNLLNQLQEEEEASEDSDA
jgi:hypothetical protein